MILQTKVASHILKLKKNYLREFILYIINMIGTKYLIKSMILFIINLIKDNLLIYKDFSVIKMYRFEIALGKRKYNGEKLKAWIFILQDKNF